MSDERPSDERPEQGRPEQGRRLRLWDAAVAVPAMLVVAVLSLTLGALRQEPDAEPRPAPVSPAGTAFLYCSDCHGDLDRSLRKGENPILLFTHEQHFGIGVSDCGACHVANTHEPDRINRPTMVMCFQCHTLEEGMGPPGACSLCHPKDLDPEPRTHLAAAWPTAAHAEAALRDPFDCATCHQQSWCDRCHGLRLPHPAGFQERPHAEAFFEDPALCDRCHPRAPLVRRDACDRCHHPQGPEATTWIAWHPETVASRGAEGCFGCHATETCRTCHREGPERFTSEDLQADRALLIASPEAPVPPGAVPDEPG
jgi:hypothetical protein